MPSLPAAANVANVRQGVRHSPCLARVDTTPAFALPRDTLPRMRLVRLHDARRISRGRAAFSARRVLGRSRRSLALGRLWCLSLSPFSFYFSPAYQYPHYITIALAQTFPSPLPAQELSSATALPSLHAVMRFVSLHQCFNANFRHFSSFFVCRSESEVLGVCLTIVGLFDLFHTSHFRFDFSNFHLLVQVWSDKACNGR